MPARLRRSYKTGYLHFITFSCYQRRPLLEAPQCRDLFLRILEETRVRYRFIVVGYVVMPEHVHLLISEPDNNTPSVVMQVLKQRFARELLRRLRERTTPRPDSLWSAVLEEGHVWQRRFYDFVVWNPQKRAEKLRYIHRNPVKRGLVTTPEEWKWSSLRHYANDEAGPVLVNEQQAVKLKLVQGAGPQTNRGCPTLARSLRKGGIPRGQFWRTSNNRSS
jgi:putative transposase